MYVYISERWGFEPYLRSRHFLNRSIRSRVENEWCCPRCVTISNVKFTTNTRLGYFCSSYQFPWINTEFPDHCLHVWIKPLTVVKKTFRNQYQLIWNSSGRFDYNELFTVMHCAGWRMCALVNYFTIVSGNGLSHVWYRAITETNADFIPICPPRTHYN